MENYLAERTALIESAAPGEEATRLLCALTDEAVRDLARAASPHLPERWALISLGGWGAGALQPHSDLDILVLSDAPAQRLRPFVEAVLYPLWDAGLEVGHQVRSSRQQLRAMRDDIKTCTAALTARPFAGDTDWAAGAVAGWLRDAQKRSRRLSAWLALRERPGSPYLLEPDLKEGAGGRRDYDELVWRAVLAGGPTGGGPAALVDAGLMTAEELAEAVDAASIVAAARWELQRATGRDLLTLDAAADLAYTDAEALQAALARTALVLTRVRDRTAGLPSTTGQPLDVGELFARLDAGEGGLDELELAAQAGRLERALPGMRELMTCRRPGLGHQLTVGAHSLRTAALVLDPGSGDGALVRSRGALDDPRIAQVAALVHDVGKQEGGVGHAERGAIAATAIAGHLGLGSDEMRDVSDLVRSHLLLVETALREDLDDEDVILRCASRLGRRGLIAPLHLLTAADSRATGPATWSAWTAALVGILVARLDVALSPDVDGAGLAARGESTREACLAGLPPGDDNARAFVAGASLRYLASRSQSEVARDASLVAQLTRSPVVTEALLAVSPGPAVGAYAVTIASENRPELLARLSGAMALAGLDILSVEAHGVTAGITLDTFVVTSATARPVTTETFATLERLVRAALRDRLELAVRLRERRRHYPARASGSVSVSVEPVGWMTELRVAAPDRPGLLHDIARAVSATGLGIGWAKVRTIDGVAHDVFSLVGPDGGPADDPGLLGHVTMRIREAL